VKRPPGSAGNSNAVGVDIVFGILILAVSVVSVVVVGIAFVWAARKDGEEDRALQKRLGIRRKTRLGR
jgi:hypothetical protein